MQEQTIINKLIELSEGKLASEEWNAWFSENAESIENICGRRFFLEMKPKEFWSDDRNALIGQIGAVEWLKTKAIEPEISDIYQKKWDKEFDDYCRAKAEERKQLKKTVKVKFGYLEEIYPKLLRQLAKSYDENTKIGTGKTAEEITAKENELSVKFSAELRAFFGQMSVFKFEGIEINFDELDKQFFDKKDYLVLGEFWQQGDGDKLLYDIEKETINLFSHEYNPPKIFKEAKHMTDFVEKVLVRYLKQYEV